MTVKRDLLSINRSMRGWQRLTGESVAWAEYDPASSSKHAVYDEGPDRVWRTPFFLPVMFLNFVQEDPIRSEDGTYFLSTATFTFQIEEAEGRFHFPAENTGAHFRDRFAYWFEEPTAWTVFTVTDYEKQGFVRGHYLTISVKGRSVKEEEMVNDTANRDFFAQVFTP
jgi:hypothetical protein